MKQIRKRALHNKHPFYCKYYCVEIKRQLVLHMQSKHPISPVVLFRP
jgi:hypothetical protein